MGHRGVACAVFNRHFRHGLGQTAAPGPLKRCARENHRTFSREQLATVLDANAQETSTILAAPHEASETGRRRSFWHRLCGGSPFLLAAGQRCGGLQEERASSPSAHAADFVLPIDGELLFQCVCKEHDILLRGHVEAGSWWYARRDLDTTGWIKKPPRTYYKYCSKTMEQSSLFVIPCMHGTARVL